MDVTVVPDDEIVQHRRVALLELIQKHIRQRDLMGLIDQLVVLLVTECANDSQITALLNYILLTGDEARFNEFISELTRRMPQHRERIMTIAERIHNDGYIKGEQRILRLLLQNGADRSVDRYAAKSYKINAIGKNSVAAWRVKKRGITNNSLSGEPQRGKRNSIPSVMTKGR